MKALVTGANGFVGSKMVERLLQEGHKVVGLVRKTSDMQFINSQKGVKLFEADITKPETLKKPMEGIDTVFHIAAYSKDWGDWDIFRQINVQGVDHVMKAARSGGVKSVVHISSVSVYGFPGEIDIRENNPGRKLPQDQYCTTKLEGELVAMSHNNSKFKVTALRPAGVYGPNDRTTTLQLVPELAKGKIPLVDHGKYLMAPLYIDNLLDAMLLVAKSKKSAGEVYNVADQGKTTWKEYFDMICDELQCKRPSLSLPSGLVWNAAKVVENLSLLFKKKEAPMITKYRIRVIMGDAHYNMDKIRAIGYEPRVSTKDGIRLTMDWYKEYIKGNQAF